MSESESWFLGLHENIEENNRSTLLNKIQCLSIVWGSKAPAVNGDLRLRLEDLSNLETLSIFPHPGLLADGSSHLSANIFADLNPQLGGNAPKLKTLNLSWRVETSSPAWCYLGRAKQLVCLPRLRNLARLEISSQLLFRDLSTLRRRLRVPSHGSERYTEDEHLSRVLRRLLPPSLRLLSVLEFWPDDDLDRRTCDSAVVLDVEHEQGDWTEVRFRDEAGEQEADESFIQAKQDRAILNLMRALCRLWLTEGRLVELKPQNPWFYNMYIHRVLLNTVGLERMLSRKTKEGYEYSLVKTVCTRSVKTVVHQGFSGTF